MPGCMETPRELEVVLAAPRGFCAGVDRAIEIVERALELYGPPVYVLHEIVHSILSKHPSVISFRDLPDRGSTSVSLRLSGLCT